MKSNSMLIAIVTFAIFIISVAILAACIDDPNYTKGKDTDAFRVVEFDSCEYIIREAGHQGFLAHKGNCKYCEARMKKLIKEEMN